MLDQKTVFETLEKHGITFFTGVPDSYLNGFCNYALSKLPPLDFDHRAAIDALIDNLNR